MTEQTAWDRIADVLRNAMNEAIEEQEYYRAEENTDRIIAIVRETMMRDDVVSELRFVDDTREAMAAALDAAFGEEVRDD